VPRRRGPLRSTKSQIPLEGIFDFGVGDSNESWAHGVCDAQRHAGWAPANARRRKACLCARGGRGLGPQFHD
jgi:hypothetical protein